MRATTCTLLLIAVAVVPALAADQVMVAQERDRAPGEGERPAAERDRPPPAPGMELDEMMRQMDVPPQAAMMLKLLGQGNIDPMMMLLLIPMMQGKPIDDDVIGPLMFMRMLSGATSAPAQQPIAFLDANTLIIVDAGNVYKVNVATMTVMDTVAYKPQAAQANPLATLLPMLMTVRSQARAEPPVAQVVPEPRAEPEETER